MKPKTLVIVLGQARADKLTWSSFQKNVLEVLDADLALCIGISPENNDSNQYWANAKYKWTVPEYEDFGDGFDQIELERYGRNSTWRKVLEVKDQWLGGIKGDGEHPGSAGLLLYFKAKLYDLLVKENLTERYSRFVITRSDFVWEMPHPKVERLHPQCIWIPYGEFYWGVTDRHAVLTKDHLKAYLDLIDPIFRDSTQLIKDMLAYNSIPNWNHEQYILFQLKSQGFGKKIRYIPYMMYAVREESTPTRWAKGEYDPEMGYLVKYPPEKIRTRLTKKYLSSPSGEVILLPGILQPAVLKALFSLKVRKWIP